jgi:hypothetical protein
MSMRMKKKDKKEKDKNKYIYYTARAHLPFFERSKMFLNVFGRI